MGWLSHSRITSPDPLTRTEHAQFASDLEAAVRALPEARKEVFLLRQHSGLTFREISERLDIPLGTALSHMHLAIRSLRKVLAVHEH